MTNWWSRSKGRYVAVADMHPKHLAAALALLDGGPVNVPADPDDPLVTRTLAPDESAALRVAIMGELERRGLGVVNGLSEMGRAGA